MFGAETPEASACLALASCFDWIKTSPQSLHCNAIIRAEIIIKSESLEPEAASAAAHDPRFALCLSLEGR
jgi:hypothetical protein